MIGPASAGPTVAFADGSGSPAVARYQVSGYVADSNPSPIEVVAWVGDPDPKEKKRIVEHQVSLGL